jgi:hypothetical protein
VIADSAFAARTTLNIHLIQPIYYTIAINSSPGSGFVEHFRVMKNGLNTHLSRRYFTQRYTLQAHHRKGLVVASVSTYFMVPPEAQHGVSALVQAGRKDADKLAQCAASFIQGLFEKVTGNQDPLAKILVIGALTGFDVTKPPILDELGGEPH